MKQTIPNIIFWLLIHCIIMTIIFSFIVEDYIITFGCSTGVISYLLKQYWNKVHSQKSLFNV
jgi:hypothetical protein